MRNATNYLIEIDNLQKECKKKRTGKPKSNHPDVDKKAKDQQRYLQGTMRRAETTIVGSGSVR